MSNCRKCDTKLNSENWPSYRRNNYIYLCNNCINRIRKENRRKKALEKGAELRGSRKGKYSIEKHKGEIVGKIPITKGYFVIVDKEDVKWLSQWNWYAQESKKRVYACRDEKEDDKNVHIYMHNQLLQDVNGDVTDHINGNGLDNRRSNLHKVTQRQNMQNIRNKIFSSRYPGVYWDSSVKRWAAHIKIKGKEKYLGSYNTENDAYHIYLKVCELVEKDELDKIDTIIKKRKNSIFKIPGSYMV